jgi:Uncharacterized conserved protein (COG2071)
MVARLRHVLAVTYAFPQEQLEPLVPPGLALDTLRGLGFAAVAVVRVERIRPAFAPKPVGVSAFMAGYRIFVRSGTSLRGLRIVRSETDSHVLAGLGNVTTRYNWSRVPVVWADNGVTVQIRTPTLELEADLRAADLPAGSPFADLAEARRFAGPMPYTFEHEPETRRTIAVRGLRGTWNPKPVSVTAYRCDFCAGGTLANAFHVADVDYRWERGYLIPTRMR